MTVRIFANAQVLAEAAADEVAGWLNVPEGARTIGLAGGSTPRLTYQRLRERAVPWRTVHAWMTDERHVPSDHPDSNAAMVRQALFNDIPATLHDLPWHDDPQVAAREYEDELAGILASGSRGLQPGLVMLGIGDDGHTASLFPGSSALAENRRDYVATFVEGRGWRLTATLGLLARARRTLFLVTGVAKAGVVAEILGGDSALPAAQVADASHDPVFLLDSTAASLLDG